MQNELLNNAVLNYIDWWKAVCQTHGIQTIYKDGVWCSVEDVPSYYPEMIAANEESDLPFLEPHVLTIVDSFAKFDIPGFSKLFEAQWMTSTSVVPYSGEWRLLREKEGIERWLLESGLGGIILPTILDDAHAILFYKDGYGGFSAYESQGVIGISNVFGVEGIYQEIPSLLANFFPEVPVVSYEAGDRLEEAILKGWTTLGPLNIWSRNR